MQKGIVVAGNVIVDSVKIIDKFPQKSMLANITSISQHVGGAVCNTGIDLKIIDSELPVKAFGLVGDDSKGEFILSTMAKHGVDTQNITKSAALSTSFTDVMTIADTGERTFFYNKGANAAFDISPSELERLDCSIFHIGYILLLDRLDMLDDECGTRLARLLKNVQSRGIKTSVDVVSEASDRFKKIVAPALKYTDYCIINEVEAGEVAGISARVDGKIVLKNLQKICRKLLDLGVRDTVVIHCPEVGVAMDSAGNFTAVGSLVLPSGYIKGTVGAGDAFCAGSLYGLYNGFSHQKMLEFASGASACNLSAVDSISGMQDFRQINKVCNQYPRRIL